MVSGEGTLYEIRRGVFVEFSKRPGLGGVVRFLRWKKNIFENQWSLDGILLGITYNSILSQESPSNT